jgi:N-acetyl-1-D-myo-inositol-2-amino-2-deoxy-alpha-D-glucopyranoside deacetylase
VDVSRKVLAVFAHPDDEALCAPGTLALCAARGDEVTLVCATRGEYGPIASPALATPETLADVREAELRASCRELGVERLELLGLPDAGVGWAAEEENTLALLARTIRELRPHVIITFGPDGLYGHPDHEAVHELVIAARVAAADAALEPDLPPYRVPRLFFPVWTGAFVRTLLRELRAAGTPGQLWSLQPEQFPVTEAEITARVEVTAVLARKLAAIRSHRTQLAADHALTLITDALAQRLLAQECFRCADGLAGDPLTC